MSRDNKERTEKREKVYISKARVLDIIKKHKNKKDAINLIVKELKKQKSGRRESDPKNRKAGVWGYPTALKIICSILVGNTTKKEMGKRDLTIGTLNKFLSDKKKNMLSENLLYVINKKEEGIKKRKTKSKEEYKYGINYDLLLDKFKEQIDNRLTFAISYFNQAEDTLNNHIKKLNNELNNCEIALEDYQKEIEIKIKNKPEKKKSIDNFHDVCKKRSIIRRKIQLYNRFKDNIFLFNKNVRKFKLNEFSNDDKVIIKLILQSAFYNYYLSCREDKTILDIFDRVLTQISKGRVIILPERVVQENFKTPPSYCVSDCDGGILGDIKVLMNAIHDIEYFDLFDATENEEKTSNKVVIRLCPHEKLNKDEIKIMREKAEEYVKGYLKNERKIN